MMRPNNLYIPGLHRVASRVASRHRQNPIKVIADRRPSSRTDNCEQEQFIEELLASIEQSRHDVSKREANTMADELFNVHLTK